MHSAALPLAEDISGQLFVVLDCAAVDLDGCAGSVNNNLLRRWLGLHASAIAETGSGAVSSKQFLRRRVKWLLVKQSKLSILEAWSTQREREKEIKRSRGEWELGGGSQVPRCLPSELVFCSRLTSSEAPIQFHGQSLFQKH
ncbi:uncharacterized protein LOC132166103 [Corylus avellana]|uniref:uncharacterized protein LOC132166103 n=1 Tax=Corylus avellana TaxID=13451 RepID=UPI00286D151A|nr:uncharacterized protein LOC132166103 [Corylus avellana]XP_059432846.1 uncharacterized protein LOC132166103 [Corylus avellana]